MKNRYCLTLPSVILMFVTSIAQGQDTAVAPTAFEAFVSAHDVAIVSERSLDPLRTIDSSVRVTVVEAISQTNPNDAMHGFRIDLSNNAWSDSVYLDERQMADLALQLRMMARTLEEWRDDEHPLHDQFLYGNRTLGSKQCWINYPSLERILCPNYVVVEGYETFSVQVNGSMHEVFPLTTRDLVELARLVQAATSTLTETPIEVGDVLEITEGAEASGDASNETHHEIDVLEAAEPFQAQYIEPAFVETEDSPLVLVGLLLSLSLVLVLHFVMRSRRTD